MEGFDDFVKGLAEFVLDEFVDGLHEFLIGGGFVLGWGIDLAVVVVGGWSLGIDL